MRRFNRKEWGDGENKMDAPGIRKVIGILVQAFPVKCLAALRLKGPKARDWHNTEKEKDTDGN